MYMPMSLLFKNNNNEKTHMYSQHILLALLWPRKEETVKKKCYKGKQNKKTNVQAVILTCVSRGLETVCSVFMSVSVSVCVCVCMCVVLHFQWLPYLNVMKSVIPGNVKTCQFYNKCDNYCMLPDGVEN